MNKYQIVHQIGLVFTKSTSPADGLKRVARLIANSLKVWCSLYSYDSHTRQVTMVAGIGVKEAPETVTTAAFGIETGLIGLVMRNRRLMNLDDAEVHPDYHAIPGFEDTPETTPHGALIAPLMAGNRVIGAIVLSRRQRERFSSKIVGLIEEIVPALSVFIINTALMRNTDDTGYFVPQPVKSDMTDKADVLLTGTPITGGVVYGNVVRVSGVNELLDSSTVSQPVNLTEEAIACERECLMSAMDVVRSTASRTAEELASTLAEADCNIFEMHAMMVDDPSLQNTILGFIDQGYSITTALASTLRVFSEKYSQIQDETLRERLYDIKDVLLNLKNAADNLRGYAGGEHRPVAHEPKNAIIVAKELLASQLVSFNLKRLAGIVCEDGGATSHAAILARALQITMMVGVPDICAKVKARDGVLLDCDSGKCFLRPSLHLMRNYSAAIKMRQEQKSQTTQKASGKIIRTTTADGTPITFAGNLALLCETPSMRMYGIEEIGLYRTEFMYMLKSELPTEADQFALLKKVIETTNGIPLTVRLLDAGGDKPIPYLDVWQQEQNPALGWRGLRFLLSNPSILQPHLRAILRAAACGKVRILVPMVADVFDLMQIREALSQAEMDLQQQGIPYSTDYQLGVMLEIPSAVYALKEMLPYVNFVSIGTNDLVQFMFAVDRGNQQVRKWYRQCNPILLKVIHDVCKVVDSFPGKYVSLCGELAGKRRMLPVLLGAGLRKLSMTPSRIPKLREVAARYTISQCEALYKELMAVCHTEMDVLNFLKDKGIES